MILNREGNSEEIKRYQNAQARKETLKRLGFNPQNVEVFDLEIEFCDNPIYVRNERNWIFSNVYQIDKFEDLTDIAVVEWKEISATEYAVKFKYPKYYIKSRNEIKKVMIESDCKIKLKEPIWI